MIFKFMIDFKIKCKYLRSIDIFYKMFSSKNSSIINFLSNKSNILEDFQIVSKMPKWTFFKELF